MNKHSALAYIVVFGQVILAMTFTVSICLCLFYKNYAEPSVLSAIIVMLGTLIGNLGSILGGPRQMSQQTEITNSPSNPVNVTEKTPEKPADKPTEEKQP